MYPFPSSSASTTTAPPSLSNSNSNSNSTWGPSAEHFDINVASILIVLVLASIVAFVLHAFIRFLLLRFRQRYRSSSSSSPTHPKIPAFSLADAAPASIYSPGATELAGGAECSICLTEFLDGDRVRVLPACNHGFHVKCVEKWLVSKSSCPTCRTSCRPTAMATADPEP